MSRLSRIGGRRAHWIAVAAVSSLIVTLPATALPVGSALATPGPLFSPGSGAINLHVTSSVASKVTGTPFDGVRVAANGDPIIGDIAAGAEIHGYQWLINEDNTGDSRWDPENCLPPSAKIVGDPVYGTAGDGYAAGGQFPEKCNNPSIRSIPATAPVVASGDETDLSTTAALNLPNGKYLLSITAPGFKIDGVHFVVNGGVITANNKQLVGHQLEATMNPMPVQTTTVRVNVFNDVALPDGAWDGLSEPGLAGFTFHMTDVLGDEVTTDVFGNPLCTEYYRGGGKTPQDFPMTGFPTGRVDYAAFDALPIDLDADGVPMPIESTGGFLSNSRSNCVSNSDGEIMVPNLGPNRYAVTVVAPDADQHVVDTRANAHNATVERWIKTTTLEGGHDWDAWNQEGGTGYDTERIIANEQTPPVDQGYVAVTNRLSSNPAGTGSVEGVIAIAHVYVPGLTGQANFGLEVGSGGTKTAGPIKDGVVALTCISGCPNLATDQAVYVQRTDLDASGEGTGHFKINNVPAGQYVLSMWDEKQDFIIATTQINVVAGKNSNIGTFGLSSWFTHITGTVFVDSNGNGKQDYTDLNHNGKHDINEPGEVGVPRFGLGVKGRDNTSYDQGQNGQATNDNGEYDLAEIYPLTQYMVLEAYNPRYKTTGITFQSDNQPTPTTFLTGQVDLDMLPIIGLSGRVDWGVQPYQANENGGIVGTVSYDSTRNEHNPAQAGTESYQPSVAGIQMQLWTPGASHETYPTGTVGPDGASIAGALVPHGVGGCARPAVEYGTVADGSSSCAPLDQYVTETWARPKGCVARDAQGVPFTEQMALPAFPANPIVDPADPAYAAQPDCVEAPMTGVQFGGDGTVDGNYGFADTPVGDYLVEAVVPTEANRGVTALNPSRTNKPLYKFTDETSINVFSGDTYVPQNGYSQDDNFNRAALGGLWSAPGNFSINSNRLRAGGSGGSGFTGSAIYTSPFGGVNAEVTLAQLPSGSTSYVGLVLKADAATNPTSYLWLRYRAGQVSLVCHGTSNSTSATACRNGNGTVVGTASAAFSNGQILGARMVGTGASRHIEVLRNGVQVASFNLSTTQWNAIRGGLFNGVRVEGLSNSSNSALFDNFHTDSLVPGTPGAPTPHVDTAAPPRDKGNVNNPGDIPQCAGPMHTVDDHANTDFVDAIGGSLYNGTDRPECNMKVVRVKNGSSVAPTFSIYTDVPIPARFHGIVINDLNLSPDPRSTVFGEAAPAPNLPVGVYDELGNRKLTVTSDYNGFYELLVPSTDTYNCPLPAGPCPNVYRLIANDPGQPTAPNTDYNPIYRTIATNFQAWPGVIHPVDQAPTSLTNVIMQPGSQLPTAPLCAVNNDTTRANPLLTAPEFYTVTDPIVTSTTTPFTIFGAGLGATTPTVTITPVVGGTSYNLPVSSYTPQTAITVTVPTTIGTTVPGGVYHLKVTAANGLATVNGVDIHVVRGSYNPTIRRVGPGRTYDPSTDPVNGAGPRAIQRALDAGSNAVVVVYPNTSPSWAAFNPNAAYFENIIIHSNVKLQGVGAGGPGTPGSTIDGSSFWEAGANDADGSYSSQWLTGAAALMPNVAVVPSGQTVMEISGGGGGSFTRSVDGFTITGGDQQGFPNTINQEVGATAGESPIATETQGGGMFVFQNVTNLVISNNVITGNGGSYGGAIRVGTPGVDQGPSQPNGSSQGNTGLKILNNRIVANGGSFLAGAVSLFNGTTNYLIDHNDFCGNYSAEYGGAISHYGLSSGGAITNNRIYFNAAYDEGGGILIAGELPAVSTAQTQGSGNVTIDANLIQDNLSNDDGGGLRFLMASGGGTSTNWKMTVTNNIIANNVATHEGGGVAIDDTPNVDFMDNTVVRNITTATAVTSDGRPAPAGLSTGTNSALLQSKLPPGSLAWSKPNIVNNIFADNRAGSWTPTGITGIGKPGDSTAIVTWDMGTVDALPGGATLTPTFTITQSTPTAPAGRAGGTGYTSGTGDTTLASIAAVGFKQLFETGVNATAMRTNPNFRSAMLVVVDTPVSQMGDYHLATGSPAIGTGSPLPGGTPNPATLAHDVDQQNRSNPIDRGADEFFQPPADLGVTKTDGVASVNRNQAIQYTIVVTNHGPAVATASVTDTFPAQLTVGTWTCTATAGSSCGAASGTGNLATSANLANGGVATYLVNATVNSTAVGTIANTVTVGGSSEPTPNVFPNSATDTDTVNLPPLALPALPLLDNFNRANFSSLGASWSQFSAPLGVGIGLRVDTNQAYCSTTLFIPAAACLASPNAFWTAPFLAKQGAALTLANTTINGSSVLLKATGGTPDSPLNYIRVRVSTGSGGQVIVETTTNSGGSFTTQATFPGAVVNGNILSAVAYDDGTVYVYRTVGSVTTQLGAVAIAGAPWTGSGRIGIRLPLGARVDNFSGGTVA